MGKRILRHLSALWYYFVFSSIKTILPTEMSVILPPTRNAGSNFLPLWGLGLKNQAFIVKVPCSFMRCYMMKLSWWKSLHWLTTYNVPSVALGNSNTLWPLFFTVTLWGKVSSPPFSKGEYRTWETWLHQGHRLLHGIQSGVCLALSVSIIVFHLVLCLINIYSFIYLANVCAPTLYLRSYLILILD